MDILTRRLRDLATHIKTIFDGLNSRLTKIEGVGADATRTALSGKQPLDATLTALSGANWVSGTQLLSLTAADTITLKTVGAAAGNILDKAAGDGLYQPIGAYLTANQAITLSGDASGSGTTAITVTIGANKVTRAMLAQATGATILGAAGAGNVSDLTAAQAKTFLAIVAADVGGLGYFATGTDAANLTGTVAAGRLPAFAGGDVTSSAGSAVLAIGANKVTRSMMAATAGATILGSTGAGNVADLTAAQVKTFLAIANTDVSGLGTASTASTGTSGHTVPFLDGANTFTGTQTITGDVKATGGLRAVGALTSPAGFAVDVYTDTVNGFVRAYNSTTAGYGNLNLVGVVINFLPNGGGTVLSVGTAGITVTGTLIVGSTTVFNSSGVLQAAAFPAQTGDVTNSAGSLANAIGANVVTYAKFQTVAANALVGNPTGSTATAQAITLAGGLGNSGTTLTINGAVTAATSVAIAGAITSSSASAGIGYATGAGGTAAQSTSKATTVSGTNKRCVDITLNAAALAASTTVSFTFTNTALVGTDNLIINHISVGTFGSYTFNGRAAAGSATIDVRNVSLGSLSEAIVIRVTAISGATS